MTVKSSSNGTASKAGATVPNDKDKKSESSASKTSVNEEGKLNSSSEIPPTPHATVEDKIQKVFSLNELIEKRGLIKNHLLKVDALKFDDFDEKNIITITAPNNSVYTIKSGFLCTKVAALLKDELTLKVKEVETEFNRQVKEVETPFS